MEVERAKVKEAKRRLEELLDKRKRLEVVAGRMTEQLLDCRKNRADLLAGGRFAGAVASANIHVTLNINCGALRRCTGHCSMHFCLSVCTRLHSRRTVGVFLETRCTCSHKTKQKTPTTTTTTPPKNNHEASDPLPQNLWCASDDGVCCPPLPSVSVLRARRWQRKQTDRGGGDAVVKHDRRSCLRDEHHPRRRRQLGLAS